MPDNQAPVSLRPILERHGNLQTRSLPGRDGVWLLLYFSERTDTDLLQRRVIAPLQEMLSDGSPSLEELVRNIPLEQLIYPRNVQMIVDSLIQGWSYLCKEGEIGGCLLQTQKIVYRDPAQPEVESQIIGPQLAFSESLKVNLAIIRQYLPDPHLRMRSYRIGESTRTEVVLLYLENKAASEDVERLTGKLAEVKTDWITDSMMLGPFLDDNPGSLFPQMITSERPDRVIGNLMNGKVAILIDGSPFALITPSRLFDFFESAEDRYIRKNMATFQKVLRMTAMFISVFFTPMYVAALTFHYQLIPSNMLVPLAQSRSKVPFPPLMEALLLEFIIELLREAGARLPTKVGQTMGIVGGIVIGQAAVQAGFTSNILIIIVALAALASFITPVYLMGAAIRILRFPMLILAGTLGAIGIMAGVCFVIMHLLRLSTNGHAYLYPLFPIKMKRGNLHFPWGQKNKRSDIYEEPAGDGS